MSDEQVSKETVYEQLYAEMRRHRDYQMVITGWYTTLVLAAIGGLIALSSAWAHMEVSLKWFLGVFFACAGLGISYVVWYSHDRYKQLRTYADEKMEPSWKKLPLSRRKLQPYHILIAMNLALSLVVILVLVII